MQSQVKPKSYDELKLLYMEIVNKWVELSGQLFEFTDEYRYSGRADIVTGQADQEKKLKDTNVRIKIL